uniref:Putative secreted protein n=1 Tax=Anopheles darlingi TaxID=43151 RepID=A0A2M4DHH1_ANODA
MPMMRRLPPTVTVCCWMWRDCQPAADCCTCCCPARFPARQSSPVGAGARCWNGHAFVARTPYPAARPAHPSVCHRSRCCRTGCHRHATVKPASLPHRHRTDPSRGRTCRSGTWWRSALRSFVMSPPAGTQGQPRTPLAVLSGL